ncbi:DUF3078 domain-containing protein [Mucilaginibacter gotjawali]|uniref:Uncharacterized protein n=2 Tax=Mucilaginibacter gotjawali TaxID=1550579 RepID=A0A0X8X527_9SPHI|nr:DUF3078 domain-containing protein [Mucilaginibacter gotjawali]MBB3058693.1 hypothetical protein [Mucilaginibacter gotjawali]BAU55837.1 hypothetical protein MgSA37_04029 [Mucilaginibacter gotjawali]
MKQFLLILLLAGLSLAGFSQTTAPKDTIHPWTIHGQNTILISQSSFSNWAAGGVNAFSGNVIFDYDFDYKRGSWSWDNKTILAYGLSDQTGLGWRKNDDRIILNSLLGYKAAKYWLYTFYANFQTQLTNGYSYDSNNNRTLISALFAPAYLTFGPGFAFKKSDNFRVNISPLAAKLTFVQNDSLASVGAFGVTPGENHLFEFGASLDAYYKVNLDKNIAFENILKLFSNYRSQPQNIYTDYSANIFMKVNKLVTVNAGVELIADPNAKIPVTTNGLTAYHSLLQVKQIFGAGLTYKF